jgi:serine-type D-Ala-D-Ala carboxypeptidase/endopeptidase (penicillin-binding protein 4)
MRSIARGRWAAPLLACWIALPSAHADWQQLAQLQQSGARVSAAAVDLDDNAVIQRLNPDLALTPASLSKLVVAAAALDVWNANQMFRTRVYGSVAPRGGVLAGDLIVQGSGDTSLTGQDLWLIAAQLKSFGIRRIAGGVKMRSAPFPSVLCETKDRCEAETQSDTAYNTLLSSIGVDYGTWCLDIRAQTLGQAATVSGCSVTVLPIDVVGSVATTDYDDEASVWAERRTGPDGTDRIHVGGRMPLGSTQRFYRSMSNPALGTGSLLATTLAEVGIETTGGVSMFDGPLPPGAVELAAIEGLALKEQLGRMLRFSNNYIADVLTLGMASQLQQPPPTTLADASAVLTQYLQKARPRDKHAGPVPPRLASGSGLTPENLLSANDLVTLLGHVYRDPRNFGTFYGGLVVPRDAPFLFLRQGSTRWQNRVALKTGTMSDPHSVCGVAGYLRKQNGGWIAFAIIVNGGGTKKRIPLYVSMQAIKGDVDRLLTRF